MKKQRTENRGQRTEKRRRRLSSVLCPLFSAAGVTLVELMISVALTTVVVGGMAYLMVSYTKLEKLTRARVNAQQNVRVYLDLMIKTMREASASTVVIDQATGEPPWSRITFTNIDGVSVSYYQQRVNGEGRLYQTVGGVTKMLATNLRTMKFTYPSTDDSSILGVSLCFEEPIYGTMTNVLHLSVEKVRLMN